MRLVSQQYCSTHTGSVWSAQQRAVHYNTYVPLAVVKAQISNQNPVERQQSSQEQHNRATQPRLACQQRLGRFKLQQQS